MKNQPNIFLYYDTVDCFNEEFVQENAFIYMLYNYYINSTKYFF